VGTGSHPSATPRRGIASGGRSLVVRWGQEVRPASEASQ